MDINKADLDKHCSLNTVKEGKTTFSILDQKRAETVRILQEQYGSHQTKTSFTHWNTTLLKE